MPRKLGLTLYPKILKTQLRKQRQPDHQAENSDVLQLTGINDKQILLQTLDFSTIVDPYLFGQIAATNALSDIYAMIMGGKPLTTVNIVCFPEKEDKGILSEILRGSAG